MRLSRIVRLLPFFITCILFIIPFFWLKPGEIDLGGDSSRLFYYDPVSYLRTHMLYNVIPSGIGGDALSYYAIPYFLLLAILRSFASTTVVIDLINSFKLAGAFFAMYLFIRAVIDGDRKHPHQVVIASSLGGIFYVFSPILVHSGWDRAILSHIQIVLNPLFAYLLLRFMTTRRSVYMGGLLLLSFLFSFNFSFLSAPGFFAFYPLVVIFLGLYSRLVLRQGLPWKGLLTGALLFFGVQSFHIMPHVLSLLFGKSQYTAVFSDVGKYTRGLDYFVAIAPSIKASISFLGLAQLRDLSLLSLFNVVFPVSIVVAFVLSATNRVRTHAKRTLILVGIFFLITLFFVTANISWTGFTVYKFMFHVPGFKMFRNFFAQWSMVYVFFYALLLGVAWRSLIAVVRRRVSIMVVFISCFLLVVKAMPLLRGELVRAFHFESLRVPQVFRIDPLFEKALSVVKNLRVDGKILSLPLPGPGYQVIAGKDGGAYIGPSFFSYLTGKNDFSGYDGLEMFGDVFLDSIVQKDYRTTERLLSLLNVRYIFYNSDPAVYEASFPKYPYNYVGDFLPATQKEYQDLLTQFPLDTGAVVTIGKNYHVLPIADRVYLPHIYTATSQTYATYPESVIMRPDLEPSMRPAVYYYKEKPIKPTERLLLEADADNPFTLLFDNYHLHRHEPFISRQLDELVYPLTIVKERFELWRVKNDRNRWIDFQLYYLTKRILEIQRWGESLPIIGDSIPAPRLLTLWNPSRYNSWEASLTRYEQTMRSFIVELSQSSAFKSRILADKIKVQEQLDQHKLLLIKFLKSSRRSEAELLYLRYIIDAMFDRLRQDIALPIVSDEQTDYVLDVPKGLEGDFRVRIENDETIRDERGIKTRIRVGDVEMRVPTSQDKVIPAGSVSISKPGIVPLMRTQRLDRGKTVAVSWLSSGSITEQNSTLNAELVDYVGDRTGGLIGSIGTWLPKRQYLVTFEFRTRGDDILFRMFEKQSAQKGSTILRAHIFFEKLLRARDWQTHQSVVTSNLMAKEGYLQFMNDSQRGVGHIEIRNLRVTPLRYPKIFFERSAQDDQGNHAPKIIFRKVNPTLYEIRVTDVSGPYTIVFLEKYDDAWRLVDATTNADTILGWIARKMASFVESSLSRFVPLPRSDEVVATYFGSDVREGEHRYSLLDSRNFQIRGKKTVSESAHRRVNGYANAWTVRPEDMKGRTSYTLFIEMRSQKYLYVFSFVSLLFVVGVIAFLGIRMVRRLTS